MNQRALGLLLFLPACAAPGSETRIPAPVAIALAGQDVSALPPEAWAQDVEFDLRWYDRTVAFDLPGGASFASEANGGNALQARISDNERASANLAAAFTLLGQLGQAFAAAQIPRAPAQRSGDGEQSPLAVPVGPPEPATSSEPASEQTPEVPPIEVLIPPEPSGP